MGRRKKQTKELVVGTVYVIDRRISSFVLFRRIISRQHSKNLSEEHNAVMFTILPAPDINTILVTKHTKLFGKDYAKVIVSNKRQGTEIGYLSLVELKRLSRGRLKWKIVE